MPKKTRGEKVSRPLIQRSNLQLAHILMCRLYRHYDDGGHSHRSIRSQLLESGLRVCGKAKGPAPETLDPSFDELEQEIGARVPYELQLGLFQELSYVGTDDYLALVIRRVRELHLAQREPSLIEGRWIDLLAILLQVERRVIPVFPDSDIIWEGRNRCSRTAAIAREVDETYALILSSH